MKPVISLLPGILRSGLLFVFLLTLSLNAGSVSSARSSLETSIKLNPDCKIKRLSNGDVIVSLKSGQGIEEKHEFTDFYADLLFAAYRKQSTRSIVDSFSKKYYISQDDCRRAIKHALNVLAEWNIVIRDNQVASH